MPDDREVVVEAGPHVGHGPREYRSDCRACRIEALASRIEELAGVKCPVPRDAGFVAHCRAKFKCFLWSEGMVRCLEQAADAGLSIREVVSAVHEARAEVGGRR